MNQEINPELSQISKPGKKNRGKKEKGKRRRRGRGLFNLILFIGIIAAVALFVWAEQQRRDALGRLQETEQELEQIRESTERRGTEVAQEVLGKVRQLMDIPGEPEPTVATIIDVEALREASPFYEKAENGDHLVITETRAILYNAERNIILDVVPVQINQEEQQQIPEGQDGQQQPPAQQPQQGQDEQQPQDDNAQPQGAENQEAPAEQLPIGQ